VVLVVVAVRWRVHDLDFHDPAAIVADLPRQIVIAESFKELLVLAGRELAVSEYPRWDAVPGDVGHIASDDLPTDPGYFVSHHTHPARSPLPRLRDVPHPGFPCRPLAFAPYPWPWPLW